MKKNLCFVLLLLITSIIYAQAPGLFNYQGVARNSVGNVLQNKNIALRLNIHDGTATGTVVYSETRVVTTNSFGLFNVLVGSSGATNVTGAITSVNWAVGNKYIQVEIDPAGGSSFINIGTAQLASVPYALAAAGAPPTGPAAGDLTGVYPNPVIANSKVTTATIADGAVTAVKIAPGVIPTSLPPSGPAAGSLSGSYPNPTIANGAVTQAMIAAGVSLPPGGAAGGDLSGVYPNPGVAGIRGVNVSATPPVNGQVLQFDGTNWTPANTGLQGWSLAGNAATDPSTNFLGTTDNQPLFFKVSNQQSGSLQINGSVYFGNKAGFEASGYNNVGIGSGALQKNTGRNNLVAIGDSALYNNGAGATLASHANSNIAIGTKALYSNTTGYDNTASGAAALVKNTTGHHNTAIGGSALFYNTTGSFNTATGDSALLYNTTGSWNNANGYLALYANTIGNYNVATGLTTMYSNTQGHWNVATGNGALYSNTRGHYNVANGFNTLYSNTTGEVNVAIGAEAMHDNTTGRWNTASGYQALFSNTTANFNVANGAFSLVFNTTGSANVATGLNALNHNTTGDYSVATGAESLYTNTTGDINTANGFRALFSNTTGSRNTGIGTYALFYNAAGNDNIALGYDAGTSAGAFNNTISIGNSGYLNGASNQAFIGNLSTAWIGGNVGWSTFSDARAKVNMNDDVKGLDFITRLKPVTYYRKIKAITDISGDKPTEDFDGKYDIEKIKFSGFLAQEVEQAANDAGYDFNGINRPKKQGDLYSLSYESFVVPLVKAVQELQKIIEQQNKQMEEQQQQLEALVKRMVILENNN